MPDSRSWLVMVVGASPGAGKSTLSIGLAGRLGARLMTEDELLDRPTFARANEQLGRNDPAAIETALAGTVELADELRQAEGVVLLDAVLPPFFWLFGRYPDAQVEAFAADLAAVLAPFRRTVLYLEGDPRAMLDRATAARRPVWPDRIINGVARWRLPHYPGGAVEDLDGVARLFDWLNRRTLDLFRRWPCELQVLDAAAPPDAVLDEAERRLASGY